MTQFETLEAHVDGRLGRLTLDRPDQLNPLGSTVLRELAEAAVWFDGTGASVVIVSGAGRAFSAGFDLREFSRPAGGQPQSGSVPELGAAMAEAVASMRAVTIASIQGPCLGGGVVLAMACDLRLASEDAWFSLPEVELGIPLAWTGIPRLVREIGPARTQELVLTGRRFDAAEGLALGLLNRVVPAEQLGGAVEQLAATIVSRGERVVATTKRQVRHAMDAILSTSGRFSGTEELVAEISAARTEGPA